MTIKITKLGDKHIKKIERVGLIDCPRCGSALEASPDDFTVEKGGRVRAITCPVEGCGLGLCQSDFVWINRPLRTGERAAAVEDEALGAAFQTLKRDGEIALSSKTGIAGIRITSVAGYEESALATLRHLWSEGYRP